MTSDAYVQYALQVLRGLCKIVNHLYSENVVSNEQGFSTGINKKLLPLLGKSTKN